MRKQKNCFPAAALATLLAAVAWVGVQYVLVVAGYMDFARSLIDWAAMLVQVAQLETSLRPVVCVPAPFHASIEARRPYPEATMQKNLLMVACAVVVVLRLAAGCSGRTSTRATPADRSSLSPKSPATMEELLETQAAWVARKAAAVQPVKIAVMSSSTPAQRPAGSDSMLLYRVEVFVKQVFPGPVSSRVEEPAHQ